MPRSLNVLPRRLLACISPPRGSLDNVKLSGSTFLTDSSTYRMKNDQYAHHIDRRHTIIRATHLVNELGSVIGRLEWKTEKAILGAYTNEL